MDVANEILDAIEIIVDKKIRENTAQIYFGVCKSVNGDSCVMSINGKNNTIHFYGSAPIVGLTYRVFVPNGNMSMAFAITGNDDRKGLHYSNPNLLDNWYFGNPVNQRGQTEYTGNTYYIDRWLSWDGDSASLSVVSGGIKIAGALYQYLESVVFEELWGKTVAISLLFADGTLYTNSFALKRNDWYSVPINAHGLNSIQLGINNNDFGNRNNNFFRVIPAIVGTLSDTILAVKLELGSQQTLAHQDADGNWVLNEIPDYGEQLRRCQRYFVNFNPNKVKWFAMPPAVASNTTEAYSAVTLPVAMRAQPTVSYGGKITLSQTDDVQVTGIQVSGNTFAGNYLQLKYSVADGLTANSTYRVQGYNDSTSYIWLSADL